MAYFKIKLLTSAEQIQEKQFLFPAGEVITLSKFDIWNSPIQKEVLTMWFRLLYFNSWQCSTSHRG